MSDLTLFSHLTLCSQSLDLSMFSDWGHFASLLAQTYEDNLGSDISSAFENFIESGQVWALGIGFILGYIARSLTSY